MTKYRIIIFMSLLALVSLPAISQSNPNFNVELLIDYASAEGCVDLFNDDYVNTKRIAALRGNLIAASTTGLIANRGSVADRLQSYLDSLKYHQIIREDLYRLEDARDFAPEIEEILDEMKRSNFSRRVIATVEQIFPPDAKLSTVIPVYVVAIGHENVDAYVRRIVWNGDEPTFASNETEGELTIVINLSQSAQYGRSLEERFTSLLGVVAHEVFHAVFGVYKETSPAWQAYYAGHETMIDALLDLSHNEGIAYYLSLEQTGRGNLPRDWISKTRQAIDKFNNSSAELLSDTLSYGRASELLRAANLSGYWDSYGAMTGMVIAREIDLQLGRQALIETIRNGPDDFFGKYVDLMLRDTELPRIIPQVVFHLRGE